VQRALCIHNTFSYSMMTTTASNKSETGETSFQTVQAAVTIDKDCSQLFFATSDFPDLCWFDETVQHPAISAPVRLVAQLKKQWKNVMLQGQKNVYLSSDDCNDESKSARRILVLKAGATRDDIFSSNHNDVTNDLVWVDSFPITRGYNDMSAEEILRKLLPEGDVNEIPSGFELVGHLAHVNLRDDCLRYKYWIGRVLLDKNAPTIKTVVNKIGTIECDNVFRTFNQEVLAGSCAEPDWSVTTVHEHGCSFQLDFRHVYWNSRLSGEHHRLVQLIRRNFTEKYKHTYIGDTEATKIKPSFVVADLMAGVGPFAIPLTSTLPLAFSSTTTKVKADKKMKSTSSKDTSSMPTETEPGIIVYANDLNPISYKYLQINALKNKCVNLECSNQDARLFLHELQARVSNIDHVIMNLPATAPEFLDAFRGWKLNALPMIHVHCFGPKTVTNNVEPREDIIKRCSHALGCNVFDAEVVVVRNISPTKNMFCVSFQLPEEARKVPSNNLGKNNFHDSIHFGPLKRQKKEPPP
jgi:tRNA (guanine37-N1)-methyltransferase